jgi:hypothetical protein
MAVNVNLVHMKYIEYSIVYLMWIRVEVFVSTVDQLSQQQLGPELTTARLVLEYRPFSLSATQWLAS